MEKNPNLASFKKQQQHPRMPQMQQGVSKMAHKSNQTTVRSLGQNNIQAFILKDKELDS